MRIYLFSYFKDENAEEYFSIILNDLMLSVKKSGECLDIIRIISDKECRYANSLIQHLIKENEVTLNLKKIYKTQDILTKAAFDYAKVDADYWREETLKLYGLSDLEI